MASSISPGDDGSGWGEGSATAGVRASTNQYTVQAGDSMSGIARMAGQPDHQELYNLNRHLLPDADTLEEGTVLVVPEGWTIPGMVSDPNHLMGDPLVTTKSASSRYDGTMRYADPTLAHGLQVNADGSTSAGPQDQPGAETDVSMTVEVVRGVSDPIVQAGGGAPTADQLYQETDSGEAVTRQIGSVAAPDTLVSPVEDSLFINGTPDAADVRQASLGDCYYQAVLLGIVNGDPGKIGQMMDLSGGMVTARLHRLDSASGDWVPVTVSCTNDLQVRNDASGNETTRLLGSQMRVANDPQQSEWWAGVDGGELTINRMDYYEMAMWSPLMEKCYARFAEAYGRYGEGNRASDTSREGYGIINRGGVSQKVYQIFYGGDVVSADTERINYDPDANAISTNLPALRRLLDFQANQHNPGLSGGEQHFLQVRISSSSAISRAGALAQAVLDHHWVWFWQEDTLSPAVQALKDAVDDWASDDSDANEQAVIDAASALSEPGTHPELWDDGSDKVYHDLNEVLGIVVNIGSDNSPGRRMMYASHAYNIHTLALCSSDGAALSMTSDEVDARHAEIDAVQSSVTLENPHARNEVDLDGDGPDLDGVNEGRFTVTLDQLFRNMDLLRCATVEHEAAVGDFPMPSGDVNYA